MSSGVFPIDKSPVYHFYLLEKDEIRRLQQTESQKRGYDISESHAILLWSILGYKVKWLENFPSGTKIQSQNF